MGFSRKRGRPKLNLQKTDYGSPELRLKRQNDMTMEALDLCLKKGLIDENEHQAGLRLRWLYKIKFGSPNIKAYSINIYGGYEKPEDDPLWVKKRSDEYITALDELKKYQSKKIVMNIAIFNLRESFLLDNQANYHSAIDYRIFKSGISALAKKMKKVVV